MGPRSPGQHNAKRVALPARQKGADDADAPRSEGGKADPGRGLAHSEEEATGGEPRERQMPAPEPPLQGLEEMVGPFRGELDAEPAQQPPWRALGKPAGDEMRLGTLSLEDLLEGMALAAMVDPHLEQREWLALPTTLRARRVSSPVRRHPVRPRHRSGRTTLARSYEAIVNPSFRTGRGARASGGLAGLLAGRESEVLVGVGRGQEVHG